MEQPPAISDLWWSGKASRQVPRLPVLLSFVLSEWNVAAQAGEQRKVKPVAQESSFGTRDAVIAT